MLQVCPNGSRVGVPGVPVHPDEVAAAVAEAVAAGATDIHLHPRGADGRETMDPDAVAAVLTAVRAAAPGIPVGVTTGAWTVADPARRPALVRAWPVRPDHASVNWHEPGAAELTRTLLDLGIGVEAGLFSDADTVAAFLASGYAVEVLRVLAEITEDDPVVAEAAAHRMIAELDGCPARVLLHGEGGGAWPVLRLAGTRGLDRRIGLEDVLVLPNGHAAGDNAELVRAALPL